MKVRFDERTSHLKLSRTVGIFLLHSPRLPTAFVGSLTTLLVRITPPDTGTHHTNPGLGILYEGLRSVPGVKRCTDSVSYWWSYVKGHLSSGLADMQSATRE